MKHVFTVASRRREEMQGGYDFYLVVLNVTGNGQMERVTIAVTAEEFEKCPIGARFELVPLFGACPEPKGSG